MRPKTANKRVFVTSRRGEGSRGLIEDRCASVHAHNDASLDFGRTSLRVSRRPVALAVALACVAGGGAAHGVALIGSDPQGTSSFVSGVRWSDGLAPSPGKTYETQNFVIRTPNGAASATFAGDSLEVESGGTLAFKNSANGSVTFSELILSGGVVFSASDVTTNLNGLITLSTDSVFQPQTAARTIIVNSDVAGSGGVTVRSALSDGGVVEFTSATNSYGGDTTVEDGGILRMGAVNAMPNDPADGDLEVQSGGTFDLNGNDTTIQGLIGAGEVQTASGAAGFTIQGNQSTDSTFSGAITGNLSVTKTQETRQIFAGNNTYTGTTEVQGGALNIQSDTALGTTDSGTIVTGAGQVELQGGITVSEAFELIGRTNMGVHLENVADTNSITGAVSLADSTPGNSTEIYTINSEDGVLSLTSVAGAAEAGDRLSLNLGGDSAASNINTVGSLDLDGSAQNNLVKTGGSTWSVGDADIADGTISSQGGVLALTGDVDLTGDMVYEVLNDAEINVSGVTGPTAGSLGLDSGDQLKGNGLVTGDVVAASGSKVTPGDFGTVGELEVDGLLDLAGTLQIDIVGTEIDNLIVGTFDITDAFVEFTVAGELDLTVAAYAFAEYGSQSGTLDALDFNAPDALTTYYNLVDDFQGNNQLAWVRNDRPVPAPAPLALIGIGAFLWGGLQLRAKRRAH